MANLRAVEDQEPRRLVDEDTDQHSHPLFRRSPGMKMLGARGREGIKHYRRRNKRFLRNEIQYFQEIIQTTFQNVETYTNPQPGQPMGRRRMAGDGRGSKAQGPVSKSEAVYVQASRTGSTQVPLRHHTEPVEGCEEPRDNSHEAVASQG